MGYNLGVMFIKSFFFGLIVSLPVALVLLRIFRGRFFIIISPYFAGALYGFWTWVISMVFLYFDVRYDFAGIATSETGFALMALVTSGHAGFISGGILAAVVLKAFPRK